MENPNPRKKRRRSGKRKPQDRLSDLPDAILHHILSLLDDTKCAVKTSVLSKRWRRLWVSLRDLSFISNPFRDDCCFDNFVRAVLLHRDKKSEVDRFRFVLGFVSNDGLALRDWVVNYAVQHNVRHLVLQHFNSQEFYALPPTLLACRTLKSFELSGYHMLRITSSPLTTITNLDLSICRFYQPLDVLATFPNLTDLSLSHLAVFGDEASEDNGRYGLLKISGPKLINLSIVNILCSGVEIFTPNLASFTYLEWSGINDFCVIDLPSLERADVCLSKPEMEKVKEWFSPRFFNLMHGIGNAKSLKLNTPPLEALNDSGLLEHQTSPFSQLKSLRLHMYRPDRRNRRSILPANVMSYLLSGTPYSKNMHIEFLWR